MGFRPLPPGHQAGSILFNHSIREPSLVIPVTAVVDDDGLVHIESDDQRTSGTAMWSGGGTYCGSASSRGADSANPRNGQVVSAL